MTILYFIVEILGSYIEVALLFAFYDLFAPRRIFGLKFHILRQVLIVCVILLLTAVNKLSFPSFFIWLIAAFFISLISMLLYRTKFVSLEEHSMFAVTSIYFAIMTFIKHIYISIIGLVSSTDLSVMEFLFETNMTRIFYVIAEKLTGIIIYLIIKYYIKKKLRVNARYTIILCFVYSLILIASFSTINILITRTAASDKTMLAVISLIFLSISLVCFYFTYKFTTMKEQKERLDLIQQRNELLERSLRDTQKTYSERNQITHDLKNHLNVLYDLAKEAKNSEISDYLSELISPFKDKMMVEKTGSDFLDTILTFKKREALEHGIVLDIDAKVPAPLCVEPVDLSAIFANLIDNAIEACIKIADPEQRFIDITVKYQNNFLIIKVENSAIKKLLDNNKNLVTTKKDKSLHGIGLQSVRASVEKYNGDISFNYDEEKFVVSIILCL